MLGRLPLNIEPYRLMGELVDEILLLQSADEMFLGTET